MIALVALAAAFLMQAPPTSGSIRGQVVDRDTGRPLPHAVVRIARAEDGGFAQTTMTDEAGAFTFVALQPGRYSGLVSARQHESRGLGDAPTVTVPSDRPLAITVRLPRALAIGVRVVDAFGDPLSRITVEALSLETERMLFTAAGTMSTDDLGRLRVFGLPPGHYFLCAEPDQGVASGGTAAHRDRLLRTCYPSNDDDTAEPVHLDRSDLDGVEIRMRRGRTFTVSGLVLDAAGAPAPAARVMLGRYRAAQSTSASIAIDASGRFRLDNVPPGTFAIDASTGAADDRMETPPRERGFVEVRMQDADVDDLLVAMRRTTEVTGRVTLEDPTATLPRAPGGGFSVETVPAGTRLGTLGARVYAVVQPDRTFTLRGLSGPRTIGFQNVPRGWYVKAAHYGTRDVLDEAVEFKDGPGAPALDVLLSNRGATVNGTVVDDTASPAAGARIYLVRLATASGRPPIAGSARATATGTFTLGPVRGGEYAVVALPPSSELPPYASASRLARLVAAGERVTLTDLDERSVQVRLVAER